MTTHYYGYLRTACGRFLPNITEDKSKVTCISCRNPLIPDVEIAIPPRPKVYFKPSKELADRVIKTLAVGASKK